MDFESSVQMLQEMLEIYSPSGKEQKISAYLKDKLTEVGFKNVRNDKVGNVYGEIGSGSPSILLCGHMDTVKG
ncbi:MAG: acetylornithine deacetylase, partial [Candidatus Bathyarchaeia archaeon]